MFFYLKFFLHEKIACLEESTEITLRDFFDRIYDP